MPVIVFDGVNASMTVGSDTFAQNAVMSRYTKGKTSRKVMALSIIGGTKLIKYLKDIFQRAFGTGKWSLYYGADQIASGLQSTIATDDWTSTRDYQPIVDSRWCAPESQMTLVVDEAPGDDIKFIVWLLQARK